MNSRRLGILCSSIILASMGALPAARAQKNEDGKVSVEITLGRGHPDAHSLRLTPTQDSGASAPGSVYIPQTLAAASKELTTLLPQDLQAKILQADGVESDFLLRSPDLYDVAVWINQNWRLDEPTSSLGSALRSQGFATREWMGRALFEMVYEDHAGKSGHGINRLRRFAIVEAEDGKRPETPPPRSCTSKSTHIQSKDIWLGEADRWPYARIIYWVDCGDGSKRAYLWEREWFVPDAVLRLQLSS